MKEPLVSVVMPSYNSEKHIAESIQSIIDQSFTDWEFIIVDGHSKDKTIDIVEGFVAKDSRIKLMYDEGKGIGPALNMGCAAAIGKYIARVDTDDISFPERFSEQVKILLSHPEVVLLSCVAEYIDESGLSLGYGFSYTTEKLIKKNLSTVFHPGVMMRKEAYMKAGGYPPLKRAEDLFLWHRLCILGKVRIIEYPLIKYRISDEALSNGMSEYFTSNVNKLWSVFALKPELDKEDFEYLNHFIAQNILNNKVRENPARGIENSLLNFFRILLPKKIAFKMVLMFKNLYGFFMPELN